MTVPMPVEYAAVGLRGLQETVKHVPRIEVGSGDRACVVDRFREYERALEGTCARTGRVERGDSSVCVTHEAVRYMARVRVLSLDHPCRVDAEGRGALAGTCACARRVERSDNSVQASYSKSQKEKYF